MDLWDGGEPRCGKKADSELCMSEVEPVFGAGVVMLPTVHYSIELSGVYGQRKGVRWPA